MLTERDLKILQETGRWRFLLSRHIKEIAGFPSQRTADRRIHALVEARYLEKRKVLYGVPSLYLLTHKGRVLLGYSKKPEKIRIEQITHDILALDILIYLCRQYSIDPSTVTSEKELHQQDGFGNRKHYPDFSFTYQGETYATEIEISLKAKERLRKNIETNYLNYDKQLWFIKKTSKTLNNSLENFAVTYPNLEILYIEDMKA